MQIWVAVKKSIEVYIMANMQALSAAIDSYR